MREYVPNSRMTAIYFPRRIPCFNGLSIGRKGNEAQFNILRHMVCDTNDIGNTT
jgi:hypothetical protein